MEGQRQCGLAGIVVSHPSMKQAGRWKQYIALPYGPLLSIITTEFTQRADYERRRFHSADVRASECALSTRARNDRSRRRQPCRRQQAGLGLSALGRASSGLADRTMYARAINARLLLCMCRKCHRPTARNRTGPFIRIKNRRYQAVSGPISPFFHPFTAYNVYYTRLWKRRWGDAPRTIHGAGADTARPPVRSSRPRSCCAHWPAQFR